MKKTIKKTISQLAVSSNRRSGFLSGSFLISPIKNLIRKKSAKIVSIITFIALTASIFMPGQQVRGADFTPSVESYQSTPATLTNNQTDYQGTPFTSENYTSVASDDSDYANTTAATSFACGTSTVSRDGITYGTVLGADGKCWLDRNLGATRVATAYNDSAAYGWIFQWGRGVDGHQIVRPTPSGTTTVLSLTDTPGHANFIKNDNAPRDWRSTRNDNLWQGEDGINNPCPTGFRLPTITEWSAIVSAAGITNYNTAFSSNLKFTTAGMRNGDTAAIVSQGIGGYYWSTSLTGSTLKTIYAPRIVVSAVDLTENWRRAYACSVRCLENSNIFMPAYASQLYTFDTSAYANQSKLELNLLAYATASAGNGITTKIWNNDTSTWETLESLANTSATMPETPSTQQITANVEDYLDVDKKIRILVHSTNPSASGTDAILNTDYLKLTVWVSPSVSTNATTGITFNSATGNGNVTNTNGEDPISRDIQWGTTSGIYTDSCSAGAGSSGVYSCPITNLAPNTTYYYRAKATNSSGSGYGEEQSFTTLAGEITVSNPTPTDITELYTDSYIAFDSGTLDSTNQVTTHIDVTLATGANQITLPDNTVITNTEGGNFDMSAFDITLRDVRSEVPDSLAAIKVGVPGTQLTFTNNPVTLNIYLGSQHNGKTMQIQYQNENEALWNDQGSCVITDSLCTFTTTHATTYSVNGDGSLQGETDINTSLPIEATIAITCTDSINMNPITGTGRSTVDASNEATCTIKTNNSNGYKLEWSTASTEMTNANSDTISGYLPTTPNTPEVWNLDQATSAWGARLKSTSTDPDTDLWGTTDGYTGNWLNIPTSAYQLVSRTTETLQTGSDEIIQFGSEIGSNKFQPTGTYATSVVLTATTL